MNPTSSSRAALTIDFFRSGLDFCDRVGTELYAVAPGKAVVIDHGWGVYTADDHLSQILVPPREAVQPDALSGLGVATGRTTGPHLHWDYGSVECKSARTIG